MRPILSHTDLQRDALKAVYDGLKLALDGAYTLACLRIEAEANDQAVATRTPAQNEKALTLDELAARLGRDKRTIHSWISDHGLPDLRAYPTADPLFDWPEVLEWMKRHRDHKNNCFDGRRDNRIISQAPSNGTPPQATLRRS